MTDKTGTIDWTKPIRVAATDWGQEAIPAEVVSGPEPDGCYKVKILTSFKASRDSLVEGPAECWFEDCGLWYGGDGDEVGIENVPEVDERFTLSGDIDSDMVIRESMKPGSFVSLKTQEGGTHYKDCSIQPIEYIFANGLGFAEGNILKYITRWRSKGGVEDLKKARHYLDMLIEKEEK